MLEDKRRFPRIRFSTPLRYQIRGSREYGDTITENISAGGIGFINNGFINPQTLVMLEINVLSRVLKSVARITWTLALPHSQRYHLGAEFMELPLPEQKYLQDFIDLQTGKL